MSISITSDAPFCTCTRARKPPYGWTMGSELGVFVCSECYKPSSAEYERLGKLT